MPSPHLSPRLKTSVLLLLPLALTSKAESFSLGAIPTTSCDKQLSGSATSSTGVSFPTGDVFVNDGGFWAQAGATWEWVLDSPGTEWELPGLAGYGAPGANAPAAAQSAFKLSPDKSTVSVSIPASLGSGYLVIAPNQDATAGPISGPANSGPSNSGPSNSGPSNSGPSNSEPSNSGLSNSGPANSASVVTSQDPAKTQSQPPEITATPVITSFGAYMRPRPRAVVQVDEADPKPLNRRDTSLSVVFNGKTPCAGPPAPTTGPSASISADPAIVSSCAQNAITTGTVSFSKFGVSSYMSSLLNAAAPSGNPTVPKPLDGASLIHADVNSPNPVCTYTAQCIAPACSVVNSEGADSHLIVQKFLAYSTIVNFNNYLNTIYEAAFDASLISIEQAAVIVDKYFNTQAPPATWDKVMGAFTPFIGLLSAALGPLSGPLSAAAGVAAGLASAAPAVGGLSSLAAITEEKFDEFSKISEWMVKYTKAAADTVSAAYDQTIGPNMDKFEWTGSELAPESERTGLFGDGTFSEGDFTHDLQENIRKSMQQIMTYKLINFALVDSGCFVQYVPYNTPVMDPSGALINEGINEDYCKTKLKDSSNQDTLLLCNVADGMARIMNAGDSIVKISTDLGASKPKGWDYALEVVDGENFNIGAVVRGSIASWQTGDFNYDLATSFDGVFTQGHTFNLDQVKQLAGLKVAQDEPGFFNIPVCRVVDLRCFPNASGDTGCVGACYSASAVGGKPGSKNMFKDNINDRVKKIFEERKSDGSPSSGPIFGPMACNFDPYTGA